MADIADELNTISTSIYGHEMRGAIHDALEKVNDDTELDNAFIVNEERDASNSWSGKKYVFSNGVLTQATDVNYKCKIYHGLNIADNTWVFDTYCADVRVPVAILCPNGSGDLLENCVPIYAKEVGAVNKKISITKESTGYPSDACVIILNSYQNEPTLYRHGLNVYTKSEIDALDENKASKTELEAEASARTSGDSSLNTAIAAVRGQVSSLKSDLYETVFINEEWGIDYDGFTFYDGHYDMGNGWAESSPYKSYYLTATTPMDVYFESMAWNYFSIGVYNTSIASGNSVGRWRKNGSENNLPTADAPLHINAGQIMVLSTTRGVTSFALKVSYIESQPKVDSLKNEFYLKISKSESLVTVEQRGVTFYFAKDTDASRNLDTWRIKDYKVGAVKYSDMEIEGVLKQQDASDFIGGYHGDESYTDITIYVDGKLVDESDVIAEKSAHRVTIFVSSDVFFCDTSVKAFTRYKQLDFIDNRLIITNRWEYVGNSSFVVQRYCAGMFSINTSDIDGYTTNITPYLANNISSPSKQDLDAVEFYGDGFVVAVKYISKKDMAYYRGTVTYFSGENPTRVKAYLMGIYEYQSTRTLSVGDVITSQVEITSY